MEDCYKKLLVLEANYIQSLMESIEFFEGEEFLGKLVEEMELEQVIEKAADLQEDYRIPSAALS